MFDQSTVNHNLTSCSSMALFGNSTRRRAGLLIVEDRPDQQTLIGHILRKTLPDLTTTWAGDGPSALAYLADCVTHQQPLPRLILLDLYLPARQDGWNVVRQLKAQAQLALIPIVILSRSNDIDDIETSYDLGAASYIAKPETVEAWTHYFDSVRRYWFDAVMLPS